MRTYLGRKNAVLDLQVCSRVARLFTTFLLFSENMTNVTLGFLVARDFCHIFLGEFTFISFICHIRPIYHPPSKSSHLSYKQKLFRFSLWGGGFLISRCQFLTGFWRLKFWTPVPKRFRDFIWLDKHFLSKVFFIIWLSPRAQISSQI